MSIHRRRDLAPAQVPGFETGGILNSQYLFITALLPRWGTQSGSISIGGQKVAIQKPRVRAGDGERRLETYEQFQGPKLFNQQVFQQGLHRVTQRD